MKNLLFSILLIICFQNSHAQTTTQAESKNWGDFIIGTDVDFNGVDIKFDWLRENMTVKISEDGFTFTIGGEDLSVAYKADMSDASFKLQDILIGQKYVDSQTEKQQREKGVPIKGKNTEAIKALVNDFVDLINTSYKIDKSYGAGFTDTAYENGVGIELYGQGNAYVGEFKNAVRDGRGNYIIAAQQMLSGTFKNGAQEGMFQLQDASGMKATGPYINGKQEGHWTYTYADGSKQKVYYKNGEEAVALTSQLADKESLKTLIIEEIINGKVQKATKPYAFWLSQSNGEYHIRTKIGLGFDSDPVELIDIKEEAGKRVETFKHNFKTREGSSNPTITFFDKRQTKNNIEYNIILHLITEKFDKKLYCLFDDASVKAEAEAKKKRDEAKEAKEMAMYNDLANEVQKIIADAPNQFSNVLKKHKYNFFYYENEMPYFNKNGTSTRLPSAQAISIKFTKDTFIGYLGDDVPKLVAALDKALSPKYKKCFNKECNPYAFPKGTFTGASDIKGNNKIYIWKQEVDAERSMSKNGTVMLFYDAESGDDELELTFHALYKKE